MVGAVEVDLCPACGSLWLDHSELQELAAMSDEALGALRAPPASRRDTTRDRPDGRRVDAPCPACPGKLGSASVAGVTVEICTRCGGVFLDAGELEKLVADVRGRAEKLTSLVGMARSVSTHGTIGK